MLVFDGWLEKFSFLVIDDFCEWEVKFFFLVELIMVEEGCLGVVSFLGVVLLTFSLLVLKDSCDIFENNRYIIL